MSKHRLKTAEEAKQFITAGKALFTVRSKATGKRFTYRVHKSKDGRMYFVKVLRGQDNEGFYSYIGVIRSDSESFDWTRKSRVSKDAPSFRAFQWLWHHLRAGNLPELAEIWHEGKCGKCGRTLSVPESIEKGIGPECEKTLRKAAARETVSRLDLSGAARLLWGVN